MKSGDRVRISNQSFYKTEELQDGKTGVIDHIREDDDGGRPLYEIKLDIGHADDEGDCTWPFYAEELEVIQ